MRTPARRLLALVALALLLPGAASARTFALAAPGVPTHPVHPGDEIVTVLPELPSGVRECELLLVPEVGPVVQVSAEREAGERVVRWRVPPLAGGRAWLVLRVGDAHEEFASARSAPLTIVAGSSTSCPRAFDASDWTRAGTAAPASLEGREDRDFSDGGLLARSAEEPDDGDAAEARTVGVVLPAAGSGCTYEKPLRPAFDRQPRFAPLRN